MGFSRQKCWSVLSFSFPGDLPNPGIKLWSPTLQADSVLSEPPGKPFESGVFVSCCLLALPYASSVDPQSQTFWRLVFLVQYPWTKESSVGLRPRSPWEEPSQFQLSSCLWVTYPGVWVLTILFLCPSYPSHCGSFFILLAVKNPSC